MLQIDKNTSPPNELRIIPFFPVWPYLELGCMIHSCLLHPSIFLVIFLISPFSCWILKSFSVQAFSVHVNKLGEVFNYKIATIFGLLIISCLVGYFYLVTGTLEDLKM